ncbi:MAG: diguanylate cyclase domain-containing protein [Anaeroplasmataceae bacterium]
MNITNLEITQATIELSLAFSFIIIALLLIFHSIKKEGMKEFITMFFTISIVLISESLAYICRGNTQTICLVVTRVSNFMVFFMNFFLMSVFIRYLFSIFKSYNINPPKIYLRIVDGVFLLAFLILFINIFTGWMYTFDESNYYSRNYMWYAFTALSTVVPVVASILCIKNRKSLSKIIIYSILLYVWLPLLFVIVQAFIYGYSIISIASAVDLFIMFAFYLMELRNNKIDDSDTINFKIKKIQSIIIFSFLSILISASIISCIISINRMVKENNKSNEIIASNIISDKIEYEIERLVTVSETMSQAFSMKEALKNSDKDNPDNVKEDMKNYLGSIKDGFGYQMVYAVSDNSKAYYNSSGISRIIDESNYGEDIWYKNFYDSDKLLEVNVDTDTDTGDLLLIFVNIKVLDENNNIIGICGVGVDISIFQEVIKEYEDTYNASIFLTNKDGLVLISSDIEKIENTYLDNSFNTDSNGFEYINDKGLSSITKHLDVADYYIVINYFNNIYKTRNLITPSLIIFVIGLLLLGTFFIMTYIEDKRAHNTIIEKKRAAITDEMTGLLNRSAYEQDINDFIDMDLSDYAIIQFDINGLKSVNDTYGHKAGDELIIGTAHYISNVLRKFGKCYRIGGDEFISIVKCSKEVLDEHIKTLDYLCSNYKGTYINEISVSIGIVYCIDHPDMSLSEMVILADDLMYDNKNIYYKNLDSKKE